MTGRTCNTNENVLKALYLDVYSVFTDGQNFSLKAFAMVTYCREAIWTQFILSDQGNSIYF
jgi:hypothetical protein